MAVSRKPSTKKKPKTKKLVKAKEAPTLEAPVLYEDNRRAEALQAYLTEIKRHPLLSPERELAVSKKYFDENDPESARIMTLSNLRLVVKIAYDYLRSGIHVLDLIQEGNIGLLQAVKEYNPYKGVRFSSYASYWIKAYIRSFILRNWSMVKIGTTRAQRTLFYKLQKEKAKLEALGLPPEPKYLAEKLHVKEEEVNEMSQRMSGRDLSLNAPIRTNDGDGEELQQFFGDDALLADEKIAVEEVTHEFHDRLNAFERTLAGKELILFRERLRAEEPKTLQEIGDVYGITRERVRQIEARVIEKLKLYMKENAKFRDQVIDVKPKKT